MNGKINISALLKEGGIGVIPGIGIKSAKKIQKNFLEILFKEISNKFGSINLHTLIKNMKNGKRSNLWKYADIRDISGIRNISTKSISILLRKNSSLKNREKVDEKSKVVDNVYYSVPKNKNVIYGEGSKSVETKNIEGNPDIIQINNNVNPSMKSVKNLAEKDAQKAQQVEIDKRGGKLFSREKNIVNNFTYKTQALSGKINHSKDGTTVSYIKDGSSDIALNGVKNQKVNNGGEAKANLKVTTDITSTQELIQKSKGQQETNKLNNPLKVFPNNDNFKEYIKVKTNILNNRETDHAAVKNELIKDRVLNNDISKVKEGTANDVGKNAKMVSHGDNKDFIRVNPAIKKQSPNIDQNNVKFKKYDKQGVIKENTKIDDNYGNNNSQEKVNFAIKKQFEKGPDLREEPKTDERTDSVIDEHKQLSDFIKKDDKNVLVNRGNSLKTVVKQAKNESHVEKGLTFGDRITEAKEGINNRIQQVNIRNLLISKIIEVQNHIFGTSNRVFRSTVRVDAGEYGDMVFIGRKNEDNERIEILVQNESIRDQIRKILPEIQNNIGQKGFSVDNIEVEVFNNRKGNRDSKGNQTNSKNLPSEIISDSLEKSSEGKEVKGFKNLGYNTMEILA